MAIQFNSVGQIEHGRLKFVDAIAENDTFNGAVGEIADGKFKVGAKKTVAVMQVECGDDEGMDVYPIQKGSHVRTLDLSTVVGEKLNVYGKLPTNVKKTDKLESDAKGELAVSASVTAGIYLEVEDIIGNFDGVVVVVKKAGA